MKIRNMADGPVVDLSVAGAVATIAGIEIDAAARQADSLVTVDIKHGPGGIAENDGDTLIASVVILPKQYEEQGEGEAATLVALPLDPNQVQIKLWPHAG